MSAGLIFALVCALLAIVYGAWQSMRIMRLPEGNERMREIAAAVREGAIAYLWRQYKTIAIVGVVLFLAIGFVPQLGWATAWGFFIGAVLSGASRHHRHEHFGARQRAHGGSRARRPERGAAGGVPRRRDHRPAGGRPRPARRGRLLRAAVCQRARQVEPRARDPSAGGLRLRRLADLDLRATRRRHLHQGRGRRRRPGRQGRGRHSRGRPAQPGGDRRQRRRQRRRLRRHGRRPVRDLRGDDHRHHAARRADGADHHHRRAGLSAGARRLRHHRLDRRHLVRACQARRDQRHARAVSRACGSPASLRSSRSGRSRST